MVRERGEASFETGVPVVYSILVEEKGLQHLSDVTLVVGVIHWVCVSETNKQTNKQNVNGKPAGLFLPEGPAPFARTPLLSKRP